MNKSSRLNCNGYRVQAKLISILKKVRHETSRYLRVGGDYLNSKINPYSTNVENMLST